MWFSPGRFAIGAFLGALGYLATINMMNPDADVAAYNLRRQDELSTRYLYLLSDDAVPAMVAGLDYSSGEVLVRLRQHLSYRLQLMETDPNRHNWQSFHLAHQQAYDTLTRLSKEGKIDRPFAWERQEPAGAPAHLGY